MNACYLDANVLIYFKTEKSRSFKKANEILTELIKRDFQLYISPLVLDEFLHSLYFMLTFDKIEKTKRFDLLEDSLKAILSLPGLAIVNPPTGLEKQFQVVSLMREYNLRPRDAYHLLTMKEANLRFFATFDNDFVSVFKSRVVSPIPF